MRRPSASTLFKRRVKSLLSERKALLPLFALYQRYLDFNNHSGGRADLEQKIAAIVSSGLPLNEKELLDHVPHSYDLTEAAFRLRCAFNRLELRDSPALVWDGSTLSGLMPANWRQVSDWHQVVKERLIDLCGPLDDTLERMLAG